jgi:hypothetical protein
MFKTVRNLQSEITVKLCNFGDPPRHYRVLDLRQIAKKDSFSCISFTVLQQCHGFRSVVLFKVNERFMICSSISVVIKTHIQSGTEPSPTM